MPLIASSDADAKFLSGCFDNGDLLQRRKIKNCHCGSLLTLACAPLSKKKINRIDPLCSYLKKYEAGPSARVPRMRQRLIHKKNTYDNTSLKSGQLKVLAFFFAKFPYWEEHLNKPLTCSPLGGAS